MPASQEPLLVACDAGQTGIRVVLIQSNQRKEFSFSGLLTNQEIIPQLAAVIRTALEGNSSKAAVAIGSTGLTKAQTRPELLLELVSTCGVEKIYLAHDSITGILGSIGLEEGTMTAVGTGVVTLSVGSKSIARVDGWGNLIGDCGSAYWIGRAGLERGMKGHDGRLAETKLTDILWENFSHPEEAYIVLQGSDDRVSRIASFARRVIELAPEDTAAMEIVTAAAYELALSAFTAARRAGLLESTQPLFSWAGNVMRAEVIRSEFERQLRLLVPNAVLMPPKGEPVDGVTLLPSVPTTSPLYGEIKVASI